MIVWFDRQFVSMEAPSFASIEEAASFAIKSVEHAAADIRALFTAGISPAEMASWSIKLAEARLYGSGAQTPALLAEAEARGMTIANLVERVLLNAEAFVALEARISGVAGRHRDALVSLTTIEQIAEYDPRPGWPGLG